MTAIHVVVRARPERAPSPELAPAYGLFDVVVDGINVTARIGEGQALTLLAELALAVADLERASRSRATVELYSQEESWHLGLEADSGDLLVSVFRSGATPELAVFEHRVERAAFRQGLLQALGSALRGSPAPGLQATLRNAELALRAPNEGETLPLRQMVEVAVLPRAQRGFAFRSDLRLRANASGSAAQPGVERADLHALLFLGAFGVTTRNKVARVDHVPVFLAAERLLDLAREVLDATQAARPLFRRCQVGPLRLGVRLVSVPGPLAFSMGSSGESQGQGLTFPEIAPEVFAHAVVGFVRALRDAVVENDPTQSQNLRLTTLVQQANILAERASATVLDLSLTNSRPEDYRRFAPALTPAPSANRSLARGPLRFSARWIATVPNLDLASVLLCGEQLLVGAHRETACLDRRTGEVLWRLPGPRAGLLGTPSGLLRLHADGRVSLHDLATGRQRFVVRLTPRADGGASGAVVHTAGLPKLIAIAEGDRRITALDLLTGEIRWRFTARRPAPLRVRRAGRLLLVGGGDRVLTALDAATGDAVWRACEPLPFSGDMIFDGEDVLAVTAAGKGDSSLCCYAAWTGEPRWSTRIDERPVHGQAPLVAGKIVALVVRDARGTGLCAMDRETGQLAWDIKPGFAPRNAAWLALDDIFLVNAATGTVSAIEAATGALRFRHAFSRPADLDLPRRLDPIHKNGAVFLPQQQVHVIRPKDGATLGTVPSELVPDLVRVDEQGSVYVAEESGHLTAFSSSPMLVRVK